MMLLLWLAKIPRVDWSKAQDDRLLVSKRFPGKRSKDIFSCHENDLKIPKNKQTKTTNKLMLLLLLLVMLFVMV